MTAGTMLQSLNAFLNRLDEARVPYVLSKARPEAVMVHLAAPGERWEIEFMEDGSIEAERFRSDGAVMNAEGLDHFWRALEG